jgi:hypothetical protein
MKMNLGLIIKPKNSAEPHCLVIIAQLTPYRARRHLIPLWSDHITPPFYPANHGKSGSPDLLLTGDIGQTGQKVLTIAETGHNNPPH